MKFVFATVAAALLAAGSYAQTEPKLKPDLSNIVNLTAAKKYLHLGPRHLTALKNNLFMVRPGDGLQLYYDYGANDYANFPSLITSDNVLQLFHVFFDSTLRHAEEHHLSADLRRLTSAMLTQAELRLSQVKATHLDSAALKNVAFFGVADRLLGGNAKLPKGAASMVVKEVASIQGAQGPATSAIFPYAIDFSQFIVRGHYTRSAGLGRYFRALMWFGLAPIAVDRVGSHGVEPSPEQLRQASLMVQDLFDSGAQTYWERIYDVTSLYVGDANDLTPTQWRQAVTPVLSWPQNLSRLAKGDVLPALLAAVTHASHPLIVNKAHNGTATGVQFRFMGQRSIPDSVVFNRVTGDERPWPSPLDVAAAFGSKRAAQILDASPKVYNPSGWSEYVLARTAMATEIGGWGHADWTRNLYNGSLDLIRLNLARPSPAAPQFMQGSAWADKSISSSLAFWAELRHDTILYGAQTAAEQGDGDEQPYVRGYVEPNVLLYQRLIDLLKQMQGGLTRFKYLSSDESSKFGDFNGTLSFFLSIGKRELSGGKITKDEHWKIRKIEGEMSYLNDQIQLIGETYNTLTEDDWDMALVADVHTAGQQALEVATGHADELVAVVPIEGKLYLAEGSALSFYEFRVPISARMTDHAWKQRLTAGKAPPRPPWIRSYFIDNPAPKKRMH